MNTSYQKYDLIASEFPEERETIEKLRNIFQDADSAENAYSLGRLIDLSSPRANYLLPQILNRAVEEKLVAKSVRVSSPNFGDIQDFDSLLDVPITIYDPIQGEEITVTSDLVKAMYRSVR